MSELPDDLWRRILEVGVRSSSGSGRDGDERPDCSSALTYKDLCSLSVSCGRLHHLSDEDSLWKYLLFSDFHKSRASSSSSSLPSSKTLYKLKFERKRERKLAAHRRDIRRKELLRKYRFEIERERNLAVHKRFVVEKGSQIAVLSRKLKEIETRITQESLKMSELLTEPSNSTKVRFSLPSCRVQASVASNPCQPKFMCGGQKQLVEQYADPDAYRVQELQTELKLCEQRINAFIKSYSDEKERLHKAVEELVSVKTQTLRDYRSDDISEEGA